MEGGDFSKGYLLVRAQFQEKVLIEKVVVD
jgi:hypothetical protein